jgi:hypothetical protein
MSLSDPTFIALALLAVVAMSGIFVWLKQRSGVSLPSSALFELALSAMSLFVGVVMGVMATASVEAVTRLLAANSVFVVVLMLFVGLFALSRIVRVIDSRDRLKMIKKEV